MTRSIWRISSGNMVFICVHPPNYRCAVDVPLNQFVWTMSIRKQTHVFWRWNSNPSPVSYVLFRPCVNVGVYPSSHGSCRDREIQNELKSKVHTHVLEPRACYEVSTWITFSHAGHTQHSTRVTPQTRRLLQVLHWISTATPSDPTGRTRPGGAGSSGRTRLLRVAP